MKTKKLQFVNESLYHKLNFGLGHQIYHGKKACKRDWADGRDQSDLCKWDRRDKTAKIEHAYDCARKEVKEILILLKVTTQKVKMLRSKLKAEGEMVSNQRIKEKTKDVLMMTSVHLKNQKD